MIFFGFPVIVYLFLSNPNDFYSNVGIDPEIVNNLPTFPATEDHTTKYCIICHDDFIIGQELLTLRCPGKHIFHGSCIKDWLKRKVTCPLCRSNNVI